MIAMQKRVLAMLVSALVVVLGLLWALTSLAPNSGEEKEFKMAGSDVSVPTAGNPALSASVGEVYGVEPPPAPPYVHSY